MSIRLMIGILLGVLGGATFLVSLHGLVLDCVSTPESEPERPVVKRQSSWQPSIALDSRGVRSAGEESGNADAYSRYGYRADQDVAAIVDEKEPFPDLWRSADEPTRWRIKSNVNARFTHLRLADALAQLSCESGADIQLDTRLTGESQSWSQIEVSATPSQTISLGKALLDILEPLALSSVIERDRIVVTTKELAVEMSAESFDREWLYVPFTGYNASRSSPHVGMMMFGQNAPEVNSAKIAKAAIEEWITQIKAAIAPDSWDSAGGKGWIAFWRDNPNSHWCWPTDLGDMDSGRRGSGVLVYNASEVREAIRRYISERADIEQASYIEELREVFPYDSLAKRLSYENRGAIVSGKVNSIPPLTASAVRQLDEHEKKFGVRWGEIRYDNRRSESLRLLHSGEVAEFISRSGFGVMRSPPIGPAYVDLGPLKDKDIPFAKAPSQLDLAVATRFLDSPRDTLLRAWNLPAQSALAGIHKDGYDDFLDHRSYGHVIDRDHVAGFVSHYFGRVPVYPDWQVREKQIQKEQWLITRLELVSLLKFVEPAVYVSDYLPRMDKLAAARTRPLNAFESESLSQLRSGEDLAVRYSMNHIQMVGSLRAMKQCLDCHQVPRGELLGAFSYDLWRDPPQERTAPNATSATLTIGAKSRTVALKH